MADTSVREGFRSLLDRLHAEVWAELAAPDAEVLAEVVDIVAVPDQAQLAVFFEQ